MDNGQKVGLLTLLSSEMKSDSLNKRKRRYGLFLCECGTTKEILLTSVKNFVVKSCGCYKSKVTSETHRTHGMTNSPTYNTWHSMLQRCNNPNGEYKQKNITVCSDWLLFENFLRDMGERPENCTLDRVDTNGNYESGNCRWASLYVQAYNQNIRSTNTSGRTGVSFDNRLQKWQAYISHQGKFHVLGFFKTFEEAVTARENAEIKYHGEIKQNNIICAKQAH